MKQKKTSKKFFILFGSITITLLLSLLPTFVSHTEMGKQFIISMVQKETNHTLHIDQLHLSWFGKQQAKRITIFDQNNEQCFYAENLYLQGALLKLLLYRQVQEVFLSGWTLNWKEPSQTLEKDTNSSIFNPFINILSCIKHAKIISEHGFVKIHTQDGHFTNLSQFYIEKTKEKLLVKGVTTSKQASGNIFIEACLQPPVNIDAKISSFPTELFYPLVSSGTYKQILQQENLIHATVNASHQLGSDKVLLTSTTRSKNIEINLKGFIQNFSFYVIEGIPSSITIQPQLSELLLKNFLPISAKITTYPLKSFISCANIPLDIHQLQKSEIVLQTNLPQLFILPNKENTSIQLSNLEISLIKNSNTTKITTSSIANLGKGTQSYINGSIAVDHKKCSSEFVWQHSMLPHSYLKKLLPEPFCINIPLDIPHYSLTVQGTYKRAQLAATIALDNPLLQLSCQASGPIHSLQFQGTGTYNFTDKWKQKLDTNCSCIESQFSGKIQTSKKNIYLPKFHGKLSCGDNEIFLHGKFGKSDESIKYENTSLLIYGKLGPIPLSLMNSHLDDLLLNKASFSFHSDGSNAVLKGNTQILISNLTDPHMPDTRVLIPEFLISNIDNEQHISLENIKIQTSGEVIDFPVDYLLKMQGKDARLSNFIGPIGKASFVLNYDPTESDPMHLKITTKTEATKGEFNLIMNSSYHLSEKTNGQIFWEVSPERYISMFEHASCIPSCLLYRTANVHLFLSKLSCNQNQSGLSCLSLFTQGGINGELSSTPLIFYDNTTRETFIINELSGSIHSENIDSEINYSLKGSGLSPTQEEGGPSEFMISGSVANLLTTPRRTFSQTAEWKNIPTTFIAGIIPLSTDVKNKVASLAGAKMNVHIENQFTRGLGPIKVSIQSTNLQAHFPLILAEKAILLEDKLAATLTINEEVNKAFFREFNPLIAGNTYSEHSVLLQVYKDNFYLPIRPYSFENFKIQSASLDFGKIFIQNSNTMNDIFQFLDIEEDKPFIEAWFTPIFFSVQKGIIEYKRFDALIDGRIRLALWGKTDIIKQKINTTLGIDPEVIKKYFHNTTLKTKNFFLIKIRGSISSPEVDWSSAYARIALLKSYSLATPFSSFADKLFSSLGNATPNQTTYPLPWEKESKVEKERSDKD